MRKYRFVDPRSKKARNQVLGQFLKFSIAWILVGKFLYNGMQRRAKEMDPEFDKRTNVERYMVMTGHDPTKIRFARLKIKNTDVSVSVDPEKKNEKTDEEILTGNDS